MGGYMASNIYLFLKPHKRLTRSRMHTTSSILNLMEKTAYLWFEIIIW
jgi:hypothetical protein